MPHIFHGYTETDFTGLYFCIVESSTGIFFGLSAVSRGLSEIRPLEDAPGIERAYAAYAAGEGALSVGRPLKKPLPSPDPSKKWAVTSYSSKEYSYLIVSKVCTSAGKLVGWFVSSLNDDGKPVNCIPLHKPADLARSNPNSISANPSAGELAVARWEEVCEGAGERFLADSFGG